MTRQTVFQRVARSATLVAVCALVSGCFLQPGTFDAELNLRADGRFRFVYEGEIVMAGMGDLAEMAAQVQADAPPEPCVDDETSQERACTQAELAERSAQQARDQQMMLALLGSADLTSPESAAELAASLQRQRGWNSVTYREDGVFDVSFAIDSMLSHDFDFPTIEGLPVASPFVSARLRDDARVRIEGAGLVAQDGGNPLSMMMMGMTGAMPQAQGASAPPSPAKAPEGTFRIVTDAAILANNTDEGPRQSAQGQVLEWDIGPASKTAPMALLQLTR